MELEKTFPITHKYGLHARASTKFVELAQQFQATVLVARGDDPSEVDGKSVLGILTLGIQLGDEICLKIAGDDAEAAMSALGELIADDFGGV